MAREINLVPDIKDEMIKTLKLRNFIFFLCIVVAAASVGATVFFGLIMGGQQLAIDSKKGTIQNLSTKLNSYSDLDDFLTIKSQLDDISVLTNNKKVLSRTFNILSAMLPTGADTITISELNVNLSGEQPTFTFDAQANAGSEPFIDYNVLDAFKKSMDYLRYDYGHYVDKEGNTIPAYCMIESGSDGAIFNDPAKGIYALWTIEEEGCNPSDSSKTDDDETDDSQADSSKSDDSKSATDSKTDNSKADSSKTDSSKTKSSKTNKYNLEEYDGKQVVRVWRTPQFSEWYKEKPTEGKPQMSLDGTISNVEHFQSACITYTGNVSKNSANPKWTETNEECKLIPGGTEGINISESSNGRDANEQLVLRFSAIIKLAPEAYKFSNSHMLAIAPSGRHNVTDSYVQVQAMFGERAADCAEGDTDCSSDTNTKENSKKEGGN